MRLKTVFRYDPDNRLYRLFRVIWRRGKGPGVGAPDNYDAMVTVALSRRLFRWVRECDGWRLWVFPFRLHYERSYGGVIV